jgi:hypothetical protein
LELSIKTAGGSGRRHTVRSRLRRAAAVLGVSMACAAPAIAQASKSSPLAAELVKKLEEANLRSIAAKDTERPGFFVAANHIPGVQLLVVSAKSSAPDYVEYVLGAGKYEEVYASLNGASAPEQKLFVQDMGSDGLHLKPEDGEPIDIAYREVATMTVFNGEWKRQKLSEKEYVQAFDDVDSHYARALSLLLERLKAGTPAR